MITTINEIYEFTELAMHKCLEHAYGDVAQQLDDAMHLGSSWLEICGAIKATFVTRAATLEKVLDRIKMHEVIDDANQAFGTK
ncbi:MAG: hypothetical protein ABI557_17185 [Aureliella sp.]